MKKYFVIILLILSASLSKAQMVNTSDAKDIKSKKIIVVLRDYPEIANNKEKALVDSVNASIKFAMDKYWVYNNIVDYMSQNGAKDFVENNNKTHCYICFDYGISDSLTNIMSTSEYKYFTYNGKLSIYTPALTASVYLPLYFGYLDKTSTVYAVMQLQKILELLCQEKIKNLMGSIEYVKMNGPKIIKKTLLIPKEYISPKLSKDDIELAYPYDSDICDLKKIERAILNKDPKYAIIFYVPIPVGGNIVHRLYITNAEDGDIYGVADGSKVEFKLSAFGSIGGQNKKYLINEKELKQIGKLVD